MVGASDQECKQSPATCTPAVHAVVYEVVASGGSCVSGNALRTRLHHETRSELLTFTNVPYIYLKYLNALGKRSLATRRWPWC